MATASIYDLLHQKLDALKALEVVQKRYDRTQEALEVSLKELKVLEKQLEKENRDIENLEGLSVKKLFHKVLGDEEAQLEKERQEYLEVSLKYNNHLKSMDLMDFELGILKNKKLGLPKLQKEVVQLKKMREIEILKSEGRKGENLRAVVGEHDSLIVGKKEYNEALEVGDDIVNHLKAIIRYLRDASDWGSWQRGNRKGASYRQHHKIEQARALLSKTQHLLLLFQKELDDIDIRNVDFNIDMSAFSGFTNVFFDNLITDWIRQNKIRKTLGDVEVLHGEVFHLVSFIQKEISKIEQRMVILEKEREAIVVSK